MALQPSQSCRRDLLRNPLREILPVLLLMCLCPSVPAEDAIIDHLELTQTEITQVLQILADASNWTVIPSSEVTGPVSIYLRNVSASVALENILHNNGYRFVREGNTIQVMTEDQYERNVESLNERRIYSLEYASPADIAGKVQPMLGPKGRAVPDAENGQVIVMDRPHRFDRVDRLVEKLDGRAETRVFALQYAMVQELAPAVRSMVPESDDLIVDARTNRFVVSGSPDLLDHIGGLISRLDLEDLTETRAFHLRFADAGRVGDQIGDILSSRHERKRNRRGPSTGDLWRAPPNPESANGGGAPLDLSGEAQAIRAEARALGIQGTVVSDQKTGTVLVTHTPLILNRLETLIRELDTALSFHTYQFQNLDLSSTDLHSTLNEWIRDDGEGFVINATQGDVLLIATPERAANLITWMKQFDVPSRQVEVEAHVLRVSHDLTRDLGITIRQSFTSSGQSPSATLDLLFPPDIPEVPKGQIRIGTLEANDFEVIIEALDNERATNLVSNPRIAIVDRETARIQVAVDQPFVEVLSDANSDTTRESTRFIPVGVTLEVIPFITNSDQVQLEIRVEVSSLLGTSATGAPIVDRAEAASRILVGNRQTLALGGLLVKEFRDTENKVPFLGDIPLIGHVFRSSHREDAESEIMVFITANIVNFGDSGAPPARLEIPTQHLTGLPR